MFHVLESDGGPGILRDGQVARHPPGVDLFEGDNTAARFDEFCEGFGERTGRRGDVALGSQEDDFHASQVRAGGDVGSFDVQRLQRLVLVSRHVEESDFRILCSSDGRESFREHR